MMPKGCNVKVLYRSSISAFVPSAARGMGSDVIITGRGKISENVMWLKEK